MSPYYTSHTRISEGFVPLMLFKALSVLGRPFSLQPRSYEVQLVLNGCLNTDRCTTPTYGSS